MNGSSALAAGWLLLLTSIIGATIGVLVGSMIDIRLIGGLLGGIVGTICGFILVWRTYVVPANELDAGRDYSHIQRLNDEDEDSW